MAQFVYTGTEPRYYAELGLTADPGKPPTIDVDPGDGRWAPTQAAVTDVVLTPVPPGVDTETVKRPARPHAKPRAKRRPSTPTTKE